MNRVIYTERRNFSKYDANHVLGYLNEEVVENYIADEAEEGTEPVTAYAYTGEMSDGGTLIETASTDRDSLINGIIRKSYTQSEEDAIKTHALMRITEPSSISIADKVEEYSAEWSKFLTVRSEAIATVDRWLEETDNA